MLIFNGIRPFLVFILIAVFFSSARAEEQGKTPEEPTREQLQLQISIMQDYIKELKKNGTSGSVPPELESAYIEAMKKQYQYEIAEMDLNIAAFQNARTASNVILALVVLVVIAGITFAGFQLWKSVTIAGVQVSNDLEVSASKVRVTSSVVGVVVLVISLAFLYIYTRQIYPITIVSEPVAAGGSSSK